MKKTKCLKFVQSSALIIFVSAAHGCGGGGNQIRSALQAPPEISSVTASKEAVLAGETSIITVRARNLSQQPLDLDVSTRDGGSLARVSDNQYAFSTVIPGEYTVSVRLRNSGDENEKSVVIRCFGISEKYGGLQGIIATSLSGARAAGSASPAPANTLSAPITIQPKSYRDFSRRVPYGKKGTAVTTCAGDAFALGELILKLRSGGPVSGFAAAHGLKVKSQGSGGGIALLSINVDGLETGEALKLTRETCVALNRDPEVKYADLNHIAQATAIPNDVLYSSQWHYDLINLPAAWDIETGSPDVIVAVIDTGIVRNHLDIMGRLTAGYDLIGSAFNSCDGDGFDDNPEDVLDSRCMDDIDEEDYSGYHGTHVAGTIGAATNNGIGVAGVDWNAKIMPLRAIGVLGAFEYNTVQALLYAAGLPNDTGVAPASPAKIVNMSLGGNTGDDCPASLNDVFDQLHDAGLIVFVASGNDGSADGINRWAVCNHAMAVGAVDRYGKITGYSNEGPGLDITAPGGDSYPDEFEGVLSTVRFDESRNNTGYGYMTGTSMATPHASGVAALMAAAYPDITPDQIAEIMAQTATDLGAAGTDSTYGAGLINAYAAVLEAKKLGQSVTEPASPVISVSPVRIHFNTSQTRKTAVITNTGTGAMTVSSVTISGLSGGDWLNTSTKTYDDSMVLTLRVNRAGMPGGTFTGKVFIYSNGGTESIEVSIDVDAPAPEPPEGCAEPDVHVLLYEVNSGGMAGSKAMTLSGGAYSFYGLMQGNYEVVAGTDCDGDEYICEDDVDICGAYPDYNNRADVAVAGKKMSEYNNIVLESMSAARIGGMFALPLNGLKISDPDEQPPQNAK